MSDKSSQDDDGVCFLLDQHTESAVYIVLAHWNNSPWVDMLHHRAPCFLCISVKSSRDNDGVCFLLDQHAEWEVYCVLAHWNISSWVDMLHHTGTLCVVYVGQKLTRSWWCLFCTGTTRWAWGLYSPSSLKQQFVSKHVAPPGTLFFFMSVKSSQDDDGVCFVLDQHAEFEVYIVLAHWNNSQWVDMLDHRAPYFLCMSVKSSQDHDGVCFVLDQHDELEVYIVLAHWNNSPWVDMPHQTDTLSVVYVGQKLTRWWWCLLCTGPTRWVWGLYSPSSLKQHSVSRHAAPHGHIVCCVCGSKAHEMMMVSALYWTNTMSLWFI